MKPLALGLLGLAALFYPHIAGAQPAFDVASVKPVSGQPLPGQSGLRTNPGMLSARALSLNELIEQAYGVTPLQISLGPDWMGSARFDVEGKVEGSHTREELLSMLQALLADRFRLRFHRETRELPVGALLLGKDAPKLQRHEEAQALESPDPAISMRPEVASDIAKLLFTGQRITLPYLASYFSSRLNRIVVDKTGLAGEYDFRAEVTMDRSEVADRSIPERDIKNQIYTDLVNSLGLKLESRKAPVEILAIDGAERPAGN